ncbi:thioredoxin reductase [Spiroplasma corruscae]|uniref:Thioredoxin reductase n=1 Tax=Spiroplasma corruscae TaxID=216934 RepID=A0A222EMU3_9MOLU|nr:thioredoxin-disulfide reductase [Spiroplasma corruscae]ASP27837.1 thioredoxin reductase [Spiroplasma corruscae]
MKNLINIDYDLVIVGEGPAGLSAAIYSCRAGLKTLILENSVPGGKVMKTDEVENYPGFKTIKGPELGYHFYEQAINLGAIEAGCGILNFFKEENYFTITLSNKKVIKSYSLIIATGTKENLLGIPGEKEYYGKGVSYCATCDGAFYKENQEVIVVGGGYSAIEEAIFLTRFVGRVYIVHRRQEFRVDRKSLEKAKSNSKIKFILDSAVTEIKGDSFVNAVLVKNLLTNEVKEMKVAAIFPFIGHNPNTTFVDNKEILDNDGYIITNDKMETIIPGLFAAGDVRVTPFRQIATAVSDGAIAGQFAVKYIENLN